jgi:hypothetical protein
VNRYQGSLVQMKLDFPDAGAGCAVGKAALSLVVGRMGSEPVGIGLSTKIRGDARSGILFGVLHLE